MSKSPSFTDRTDPEVLLQDFKDTEDPSYLYFDAHHSWQGNLRGKRFRIVRETTKVSYEPVKEFQFSLSGRMVVKDKLEDMTIGVVSMQGDINKELNLVDGWTQSIGSSLNVIDVSHYITQPFFGGNVDIYRANMEGIAMTGPEAPGLQTLADE